ncbi:hypothetical protein SLS62_000657 [Diatrype stigma]|uniref:Methyltransferase domain-containing protein n=1 Tax=Diatrype stigma TaxID=117547 RepID=A0AAN9UX20_9PEZI
MTELGEPFAAEQQQQQATIPRYMETPPFIPKQVSELLSAWSGIPPSAQVEHVVRVRDAAYARCPYPCLGHFRFLALDLAAHRAYADHVLAPLLKEKKKDGKDDDNDDEPLFLDVGTCLGQDVRKLAHDGVPAQRLWASDIVPELIELGFELFRDADRMPRDHFLCPGDLLLCSSSDDAPGGDRLRVLDDRVTILHLTAVFHLFGHEDQKKVADRCLRLLRKNAAAAEPVLVLGGQVGSVEGGLAPDAEGNLSHRHMYRHNVETWKRMWEEVVQREEWRMRVKTLDVQSELFRRGFDRVEERVTFSPLDANTTETIWHVFEVRISFF